MFRLLTFLAVVSGSKFELTSQFGREKEYAVTLDLAESTRSCDLSFDRYYVGDSIGAGINMLLYAMGFDVASNWWCELTLAPESIVDIIGEVPCPKMRFVSKGRSLGLFFYHKQDVDEIMKCLSRVETLKVITTI